MLKKIFSLYFFYLFIGNNIYCKNIDVINDLIVQNFNKEIEIVKIKKNFSSEPFKKWQGSYLILFVDKIDEENFAIIYDKMDDKNSLLEKMQNERNLKNNYIKNQKIVSAEIKKNFKEFFTLMYDVNSIPNFDKYSYINFFLEKNIFLTNKINFLENLLVRMQKYLKDEFVIYISSHDKIPKKEKLYHGYWENETFYKVEVSSFGSNSDFFISKSKFNSPMYGLNSQLKEEFLQLNDEISSDNYFYKKTGLYVELMTNFDKNSLYSRFYKKIKSKYSFIYGYLDLHNDDLVLKGVLTENSINPEKVYKFIYVFQSEKIAIY